MDQRHPLQGRFMCDVLGGTQGRYVWCVQASGLKGHLIQGRHRQGSAWTGQQQGQGPDDSFHGRRVMALHDSWVSGQGSQRLPGLLVGCLAGCLVCGYRGGAKGVHRGLGATACTALPAAVVCSGVHQGRPLPCYRLTATCRYKHKQGTSVSLPCVVDGQADWNLPSRGKGLLLMVRRGYWGAWQSHNGVIRCLRLKSDKR